jgi:hypothetical protein
VITGAVAPAEPIVRPDRAFLCLQRFGATLLHHDHPRLTHPPLNRQTDELPSAAVARLLKALRVGSSHFPKLMSTDRVRSRASA